MGSLTRKEIDQKALRIVSNIKRSETGLIETLQDVEKYRIFEDFGLTSLFADCENSNSQQRTLRYSC